LLLVFMPFQFSWAAVATDCGHESGTRAKHFGHHEHKHQQPAGESSEASKLELSDLLGGALDTGDCHLHIQCAADMPAALVMPLGIASQALTHSTLANAIAPGLSRPERPPWVDLA
jgi:hypothetical protein